ncbi:MAG: RNA-binding domain-containing protein [Candidatus Kryptoniota bacterium]
MTNVIESALSADSEESSIEFKESFDPKSAQDWCELIKDVVAIANTEGGIIMFGLDNQGNPKGYNVKPILQVDPAEITDKVHRYTGFQFSQFKMIPCKKKGSDLVALLIQPLLLPLVFEKPGTYDIGEGKQRNAFSAGTVYFRHGAKSEPGNMNDLASSFERRLAQVREAWLKNVRQVVEAPIGAKVITIQPDADAGALGVRLTDDPNAPTIGVLNPDTTHPFRQKDLIQAVNQGLPDGVIVNQYDIFCIRKIFGIEQKAIFHYSSKFSGHQYSSSLADWILEQYANDHGFFTKTRQKVYDSRH